LFAPNPAARSIQLGQSEIRDNVAVHISGKEVTVRRLSRSRCSVRQQAPPLSAMGLYSMANPLFFSFTQNGDIWVSLDPGLSPPALSSPFTASTQAFEPSYSER